MDEALSELEAILEVDLAYCYENDVCWEDRNK